MANYRCVFRDAAADLCGNVNVEADSLADVDEWATALLVPGARACGYEIWPADKRLASAGTAFRFSRSSPLRKSRGRGKQLACLIPQRAEKANAGLFSWFHRLIRRVFT